MTNVEHNFAVQWRHRLHFTTGALMPANRTLRDAIIGPSAGESLRPARVLMVVDQNLSRARTTLRREIAEYFDAHADALQLTGAPVQVPGGEACKNDRSVFDGLCAAMHDARLCRQSYVVVIGGGAVLDVAGFAAAVVHRGVRLVRLPTTTLAQGDSGVGVKNGINAFGKKNFLGSFSPPWAVINDVALLAHLPEDAWRGGFAEAVKVALLKDPALCNRIERDAARIRQRDLEAAPPVLERSAVLHLEHITQGGDPFEAMQARPLDFGHWSAHRLEALTNFALPHGQAVAIGIALDMMYAARAGLCAPALAQRVSACLENLGLPTWHEQLRDQPALERGLEEFREHLGGELTLTLVRAPGISEDVHQLNSELLAAAVRDLEARQTTPRPLTSPR